MSAQSNPESLFRFESDNHPHKFGQVLGSHFFHNPSAIVLDRARAQTQLQRNLLVRQSLRDNAHDLTLAKESSRTRKAQSVILS